MEVDRAHRVRFSLGQLQGLSMLPSIANKVYVLMARTPFVPSSVAPIVEICPALAVGVFSLAQDMGLDVAGLGFSISHVLQKLPAHSLEELFLGIPIYSDPAEEPNDRVHGVTREDLVLHGVVCAYAARCLADRAFQGVTPNAAALAGLLHDMGKLAIQEVMPKGFDRMVGQARAQGTGLWSVEREHLGLDHSALGADLARNWRLPEMIRMAAWLHHSHPSAIMAFDGPMGPVIAAVALADHLARAVQVAQSGSFSSVLPLDELSRLFRVNVETLESVQDEVREFVPTARGRMGLTSRNPWVDLCQAQHALAGSLSHRHRATSEEIGELRQASGLLAVIRDAVASLRTDSRILDVAEYWARKWQQVHQTGKVCLYVLASAPDLPLEAVLVEALGATRKVLLDPPEEGSPKAQDWKGLFEVADPGSDLSWLSEQLGVDWDPGRTRWVPLSHRGRALGAILFELDYPADDTACQDGLKAVAEWATLVLGLASARQDCQGTAERFADLLMDWGAQTQTADQARFIAALAEMAAGFAHELNNPLSVIYGRAQLLERDEGDPQKRQALRQIRESGRQASSIVETLQGFAEPEPPRRQATFVRQVLEEAIQLTQQRLGLARLDVELEMGEAKPEVFVDSGQIASAVSNILVNAVESYQDKPGPIRICLSEGWPGGSVTVSIEDRGCGMDTETLHKASFPFFSSKPAGRKQGMGLAYAARLVSINGGSLSLTSAPAQGTTVTLGLPGR